MKRFYVRNMKRFGGGFNPVGYICPYCLHKEVTNPERIPLNFHQRGLKERIR